VPRTRSRPTPALFYGYSPETIAQWCRVSEGTAYLYKIGHRKPSAQAVRLFVLHRDGRVLTDEWDGWKINLTGLVDPEGQETSRSLLRGYSLMMQFVRPLFEERWGTTGVKKYYELLEKMDEEHRAEMGMPSLRDGVSRR
jgi:hypothetical protein